jgi:CheY-like chemotaxis protein
MATQILVVDDDDDVRNMLCVILSAEGYATAGAADGIEALRRIRAGDVLPALIFVDLMMPRMDGEALIQTMRRDPSLAGIPVAVLSGHSHPEDGEPTGAIDARLVKPVELDDLLAVVHRFAGSMH